SELSGASDLEAPVAWPSVAGVVPATYHDVNQILMDVVREARPRQLHVASLSP
ncbi:MAG: hypothetical protein QOK11_3040, partial [Pseudonocardiales bacterium]|nr:hypothetical protein [Pseudonocardiales bacterium]